MSALFLKLLDRSIDAAWLILAVVILRLVLKRAPRWTVCLLWALVTVRLICPFSLESAFSLLPARRALPSGLAAGQAPVAVSDPVTTEITASAETAGADPVRTAVRAATAVWLSGVVVLLLYAAGSLLLLKKKVRASVPIGASVLVCDTVETPFILGILSPRIYVPSSLDGETLALVLAHEKAHLRRRDHWWKPLGFLLLTVYWLNPACWLAYALFCRDMEAACDERVIRDRDRAYRAAYSQALLDLSVPRRPAAACPLAFGETGVKERVKRVLGYQKPRRWVIVLSLLSSAVVALCFLTSPVEQGAEEAETDDFLPAETMITEDPATAVQETETHDFRPMEADPKGLTLRMEDVTPAGGTLVFTQSGGKVDGELQTGQWYALQTMGPDGQWTDCPPRETVGWEDVAYRIRAGGTTEMTVDWRYFYGELPDGDYRIAKKVMDVRGPGDYDEQVICAVFHISQQ